MSIARPVSADCPPIVEKVPTCSGVELGAVRPLNSSDCRNS